MPASYTHYLVAREAFHALPTRLQTIISRNLPLYFFGAQGADFYFFYPAIQPKSKNLGAYLHRAGGFPAFITMKAFSRRENAFFAYSLGYVTHYAADYTLHPYVYAAAGNSPLRHTRIETLLDSHFKKTFAANEYNEFIHPKLKRSERDSLFLLYTAIAVNCGFSPPQKNSFSRAISLFNAYLPLSDSLFKNGSRSFRKNVVNQRKQPWKSPFSPHITQTDGADELLAKALSRASTLMEEFSLAVHGKTPLSKELFGKSFLTGI